MEEPCTIYGSFSPSIKQRKQIYYCEASNVSELCNELRESFMCLQVPVSKFLTW